MKSVAYGIVSAATLLVGLMIGAAGLAPAARAQTMGKFQPIGCYFNKAENRFWIGAIATDPKYTEVTTYEDDTFHVQLRAGDLLRDIPGGDVLVHPLKAFNYKGAEKYQFLKYSLVLDYSGSIPPGVRDQIKQILSEFLDKLPLAVEGQIIRFADAVEKNPFTRNPQELKAQINAPISYGTTSLNDALMTAATSLASEGSNIPIRIIILFTDGYENSSVQYKDKANFLSTFTNQIKQDRIAVLALGVSQEQDVAYLKTITDISSGITGHYISLASFDMNQFRKAFDQIKHWVDNTVVFRVPKFGPDHGKATVTLTNKAKGGAHTPIHVFECEY